MIRATIALSALMLIADTAMACSCVWPLNFDEIDQDASQIAVGRLVTTNSFLSFSNNRYRFLVTKTYKGDAEEELVAWSSKWSPSCGIDAEEGKSYVIIADKRGKRLWVDRCSTWAMDRYGEMSAAFVKYYESKNRP